MQWINARTHPAIVEGFFDKLFELVEAPLAIQDFLANRESATVDLGFVCLLGRIFRIVNGERDENVPKLPCMAYYLTKQMDSGTCDCGNSGEDVQRAPIH